MSTLSLFKKALYCVCLLLSFDSFLITCLLFVLWIDSPYHDVSGLPDPYMDQMESDEKQPQHMGMTYDESLESGYSTPNSRNRRVIREIIV